jgi:hypothetical protein
MLKGHEHCPQCGKQYRSKPCGPTHAAVYESRKRKLPRAPLPRQTGGAHRTRRKDPARKAKHKKDALHSGE